MTSSTMQPLKMAKVGGVSNMLNGVTLSLWFSLSVRPEIHDITQL